MATNSPARICRSTPRSTCTGRAAVLAAIVSRQAAQFNQGSGGRGRHHSWNSADRVGPVSLQ
jgi:hypothetical protein